MALVTNITVLQAILIGLMTGLAIISWILTVVFAMRALVMSALVGLILGHAKAGLMFGAAAELIYLGLINAAGVVPPSPVGPGVFGTIIYLTQPGMTIGTAIALSLPFAIFIQFMITIIFTVVAPVGKIGETLIKNEKYVLYRIASQSTVILLFLAGFVIGIAGGVGYQAFGDLIKKIPLWLQTGLSVGGSMLPAMGFAVVLRLMLKKEYLPFLLVGFTLVILFTAVGASQPQWGFSLISIAVTAAGIGFVMFNSGLLSKQEKRSRNVAPASREMEGESDGI